MIEGVFWFLFGVLVGGLGFFGGTFLLVVMFLKRLNSASENAGAASRIASRRIGLNLVRELDGLLSRMLPASLTRWQSRRSVVIGGDRWMRRRSSPAT